MGDTPLETISTHKHLGIVLSSNLEWGPHVDVTSKAKRLLGFIWRTVSSNDPVTMKKLFVALVRPIIEYCAPLCVLQTRKVTNISWKGFRGLSLAIVFPVLGTQDLLMIPGSGLLIFPPLFLALITCIFVPCLLLGVYWGKYDISWEDYIKVNTS